MTECDVGTEVAGFSLASAASGRVVPSAVGQLANPSLSNIPLCQHSLSAVSDPSSCLHQRLVWECMPPANIASSPAVVVSTIGMTRTAHKLIKGREQALATKLFFGLARVVDRLDAMSLCSVGTSKLEMFMRELAVEPATCIPSKQQAQTMTLRRHTSKPRTGWMSARG